MVFQIPLSFLCFINHFFIFKIHDIEYNNLLLLPLLHLFLNKGIYILFCIISISHPYHQPTFHVKNAVLVNRGPCTTSPICDLVIIYCQPSKTVMEACIHGTILQVFTCGAVRVQSGTPH